MSAQAHTTTMTMTAASTQPTIVRCPQCERRWKATAIHPIRCPDCIVPYLIPEHEWMKQNDATMTIREDELQQDMTALANGTNPKRKRVAHPGNKLGRKRLGDEGMMARILELRREGLSYVRIADKVGLCATTCRMMVNRMRREQEGNR